MTYSSSSKTTANGRYICVSINSIFFSGNTFPANYVLHFKNKHYNIFRTNIFSLGKCNGNLYILSKVYLGYFNLQVLFWKCAHDVKKKKKFPPSLGYVYIGPFSKKWHFIELPQIQILEHRIPKNSDLIPWTQAPKTSHSTLE